MTTRKARATATAKEEADSLHPSGQVRPLGTPAFGNDRKKSKGNGNSKCKNAGISPLRVRKSANAPVEMTAFGAASVERTGMCGSSEAA
jgi:hypothetical protein